MLVPIAVDMIDSQKFNKALAAAIALSAVCYYGGLPILIATLTMAKTIFLPVLFIPAFLYFSIGRNLPFRPALGIQASLSLTVFFISSRIFFEFLQSVSFAGENFFSIAGVLFESASAKLFFVFFAVFSHIFLKLAFVFLAVLFLVFPQLVFSLRHLCPPSCDYMHKAICYQLGTGTPLKTIMMPGNSNGAGAVAQFPVGIAFSTGIAFAITANIADADNTAVGLNDCVINFDYA